MTAAPAAVPTACPKYIADEFMATDTGACGGKMSGCEQQLHGDQQGAAVEAGGQRGERRGGDAGR